MTVFQSEKARVWAFMAELTGPDSAAAHAAHCTADVEWRGFHPFNEQTGPEAIAHTFWHPLHQSFRALNWREDIFFAGRNQMDGFASTWVVSMGHLMGLFDHPWLGLAPTGKLAFLRYAAFHKVENDRISSIALYVDIPHLMVQAGYTPFPSQSAARLVQPGPAGHDGLLRADAPATEGEATLALINAMIGDLGQWNSGLPLEDELARSWADDMLWWGPEGIGATYTIPRYAAQHAGLFRAAFSDRSPTTHIARLAEGSYGGFFGYPNFTARLTSSFMGLPPTGETGAFRVIDIYRRAGDKLAENWVFIDLLHFWKMQGVDVLAQATGHTDRDSAE